MIRLMTLALAAALAMGMAAKTKTAVPTLQFDPSQGEARVMTMHDGTQVRYTAYEGMYFVTHIEDSTYQTINIYVPDRASQQTPIFLRTYVGGYMASAAGQPQATDASGRALKEGYVVAIPGSRGRNSTVTATKNDKKAGIKRGQTIYTGTVFFIQALAYGTDGTLVGGSKVQTICDVPQINAEWMAVQVGYEPQLAGAGWDPVIQYQPFVRLGTGSDVFQFLHGFEFDFSGKNIDTVRVRVDAYQYEAVVDGSTIEVVFHSEGGIRDIRLYDDIDWEEFAATNAQITTDGGDTATITTSDTLRSGATVTKRQLLSTSKPPADYLVSFCKTFGLVLQYDDGAKKVTLLRRRDFFQNTTVDLTGRVVRSMESEITPVAFSAKWYRFLAEDVGGSFATQYADLYGRPYGEQRVNTGYDFNAEVRDLLDGYVFKGAAAILAKSRFNTFIRKGSGFIPSPFILNGCKYTMWTMTAAHEAASWDVPVPDDSYVINYFNQFPGYDFPGTYRPELRTEDNKPAGDGANVLLMHIGAVTLADYKLTDDVAAMDVLAEGSPCWFIQGGSGVTAQLFSRYRETVSGEISLALDFGVPAEIGIPAMAYDEGATIYRKAWRPYIADKYDRNTKVLRCYVDLRGLRVGPELLRGFWYYGGSLWVLNKIENYSPTTPDPVACEFVQVQDKAAYLAGQF